MSAVPQPRTEAAETRPAEPAARAGGGRRSLAVALLIGALGAALVLLTGAQTWGEGRTGAGQGSLPVSADGRDVTGLPAALAVVGLAALVAVLAVRRLGRTAVAALLTLCGAAIVLTSVLGATDTDALRAEAAKATGLADAGVAHVSHTAWPWLSAAGGVLLLLAGLVALRYGRGWPAMSGRYERAERPARGRTPAAADPDRPEELWKALDRGEDPTRGD
ncbi:TIGR02234 family membrane protein [Streptomyces sp. NPDC001922]|uniref:TIGR02234 family membrane protein n=1 Tax=Streptomyces sp. NPDC001922 TaxID=3364624 RepID=UPI00368C9054